MRSTGLSFSFRSKKRGQTPFRSLTPFVCSTVLFLAGVFCLSSLNLWAASEKDLPRFAPLNDWLYRGGQPTAEGFEQLKKKGVHTVVNFRNERKWMDWEKKKVEGLGMKYVSLPWHITHPVKPELLDEFFEVLDDSTNRPVFFHCRHGRDRSGVMSTLALMRYNHLTEEEAREIALETIRPNFRYKYFVNKKIDYFLEERKDSFKT